MNRTKSQGVTYVALYGDAVFTTSDVDIKKMAKLRQNVYGAGISRKQRQLIFTDRVTVEVRDLEGNLDEELTDKLVSFCNRPEVMLNEKMQIAFDDIFWYGMSFFNPVWSEEDGEWILSELRSLDATSFASSPPIDNGFTAQGELLKGVVRNEKGIMECWQTPGGYADPVLIENIYVLKDPTNRNIAGMPVVLPLVPIFEMLNFAWTAQMQGVNRVGAPVMFIKVDQATGDDVAYAQEILKNWGKDTAFQLRSNMEMIEPAFSENQTANETIEMLFRLCLEFSSPMSMLGNEGRLISGGKGAEQNLLQSYIRGYQMWLEFQFENLLKKYLEYNLYEDRYIVVDIPTPETDKSELKLKQATVAFQLKVADQQELRELLELPRLAEEEMRQVNEFWKAMAPEPMLPAQFKETPKEKRVVSEYASELQAVYMKAMENLGRLIEDER